MSPRRAAVLRDGDGEQTLREHLVATVARLMAERGSAGLTVRDIAREAKVADGVLYNHFEDKEELIALGLNAHVVRVMSASAHGLPQRAGEGTVQENLRSYINGGLAVLTAVLPVFAGLLSQPKVLLRFHTIGGHGGTPPLPRMLADYLRAEQALGRIAPGINPDAAGTMIIGACHDLVLPHLFSPHGPGAVEVPPDFVDDLIRTIWHGINPGRPWSAPDTPRLSPGTQRS
jgi:AcrR family transcriptional regulator